MANFGYKMNILTINYRFILAQADKDRAEKNDES